MGALVGAVVLVAALSWAADDGPLQIEPDRPDISNSTHTVPVRALQVELGLEDARSHNNSTERRLALQTTLRTGLSDRLEVRLDSELLVRLKEDSDDVGLGDIAVGVKARVFEPPAGRGWPPLGVQPFVKLPTARMPIGSGHLGEDAVGLDAGLIYLVTRRVALDAAAEVTLNRHRPGYALRTGVSVLVGR
jgi:hypothetical protein